MTPDWTVDCKVWAFVATRNGLDATDPRIALGAGTRLTDAGVNRSPSEVSLPASPHWLKQVHGCEVIHLDDWHEGIEADAAWTDQPRQVLGVRTADCLPVLFAHREGRYVAAAHAGWRGLASGVLEQTIDALPAPGEAFKAWIGPAICGRCYQVGDDVREAFVQRDVALETAFRPDGDRWRADLKAIARQILNEAGVEVFDSGRCTLEEPDIFPSFRRDGRVEHMATLIWMI